MLNFDYQVSSAYVLRGSDDDSVPRTPITPTEEYYKFPTHSTSSPTYNAFSASPESTALAFSPRRRHSHRRSEAISLESEQSPGTFSSTSSDASTGSTMRKARSCSPATPMSLPSARGKPCRYMEPMIDLDVITDENNMRPRRTSMYEMNQQIELSLFQYWNALGSMAEEDEPCMKNMARNMSNMSIVSDDPQIEEIPCIHEEDVSLMDFLATEPDNELKRRRCHACSRRRKSAY